MPKQIQGSQTDFSFGEIDVALKRNDAHPARKAGLRQMVNARILNSGAVQNRPGRRALFLIEGNVTRFEKITMSAGHDFTIGFGAGRLQIIDGTRTLVVNRTAQGNGAPLPWTAGNLENVVYAILGMSIYLTFPGMRPQVVTWDGVAAWVIADYTEATFGNQKRTPFYRISPQGITLHPSAQTGAGITVIASSPLFTAAWVGTRIRFVGRQILITAFTDNQHVTGTVEETLPGTQNMHFTQAIAPTTFQIGDEVIGSVSGSKGIVVSIPASAEINVQLLTTDVSSLAALPTTPGSGTVTSVAFVPGDVVAGPGGSLTVDASGGIGAPSAVAIWDDEVMNDLRGYPASCFTDQFRVGFCNFPSIPGGIGWTAINSPTDLYVGANPDDAMFEIAPHKTQVLYVVSGPEGSEFVFCIDRIYYIPISETNPLKPGSVAFKTLSGDGAAQVQPRLAQEFILYANAGQNSLMAIVATGAYLRPFNTKNLTDFHNHLFTDGIGSIAVPTADATFPERYIYVLTTAGSILVGKYSPDSLLGNQPVIGWGAWTGVGHCNWISAWRGEVLFTSSYFNTLLVEQLDDTLYLDAAFFVNGPDTGFSPPPGFGPLWWIRTQSATLIDHRSRTLGLYQIGADGNVVPQFNGGEDLTEATLVAGQAWTMTVEPFAPNAQSGADMLHPTQRMGLRQIANFAVYVIDSTGFLFASLFSAKETVTSPALGTIMKTRRVPTWNVDEDATQQPIERETVEAWPPPGSSFDPRVAIIKDSPGLLLIAEIAMEVSL